MATDVRYVNTTPHTAGNGTTNGTGNGGTNSWVTIDNINSIGADLTGVTVSVPNIALDVICSAPTGAADIGSGGINGFTTNATHQIRIRGAAAITGIWDTTKYHIDSAIQSESCLYLKDPHFIIQDLQVRNTYDASASGYASGVRLSDAAVLGFTADRCLLIGGGVGKIRDAYHVAGFAMAQDSGSCLATIRNCVVVGFGRGIEMYTGASSSTVLYNNTVYGCIGGIWTSAGGATDTRDIRNNIGYNNTTDYYNTGTWTTSTIAKNLSKDDTAYAGTEQRNKTLTFVNAGTDFHLASGDTDAIDLGDDLSGIGTYQFGDDIAGTTRTAPWDIGAFDYVVPPSGSPDRRGGLGRGIRRGLANARTMVQDELSGLWRPKDRRLVIPVGIALPQGA